MFVGVVQIEDIQKDNDINDYSPSRQPHHRVQVAPGPVLAYANYLRILGIT